ncbi:hypothetical protein ES703_106000 [subsurface metagenome]
MESLHFTTRVLGPAAAYRLDKHQVTQTLRSESDSVTNAVILGRVNPGDRLEVFLDGILVGKVELISMDAVTWADLGIDDALRGGFDTLADLEQALKRGGYRFKPLSEYQFYRIQFSWLEKVYA